MGEIRVIKLRSGELVVEKGGKQVQLVCTIDLATGTFVSTSLGEGNLAVKDDKVHLISGGNYIQIER